jgi:hypothetical protein
VQLAQLGVDSLHSLVGARVLELSEQELVRLLQHTTLPFDAFSKVGKARPTAL